MRLRPIQVKYLWGDRMGCSRRKGLLYNDTEGVVGSAVLTDEELPVADELLSLTDSGFGGEVLQSGRQ